MGQATWHCAVCMPLLMWAAGTVPWGIKTSASLFPPLSKLHLHNHMRLFISEVEVQSFLLYT